MSAEPRHPEVHTYDDELPRGAILRGILATVMIIVALCFATYVYTHLCMLHFRPSGVFPEQNLSPPHEVAHVRQEMFDLRHPRPTILDRDRVTLNSFGWVDRGRRVIHVPVDVAMDLVARRQRKAP